MSSQMTALVQLAFYSVLLEYFFTHISWQPPPSYSIIITVKNLGNTQSAPLIFGHQGFQNSNQNWLTVTGTLMMVLGERVEKS